jgi:uncharacterized protein (TIGR00725 family)
VRVVSVIGDGRAPEGSSLYKTAYQAGKLIAEKGYILVTGGLFGVMEGASKGAKEGGGITVGILPHYDTVSNPYVDIKIPTGLGHARNVLVVSSASSIVVAIGGSFGTLSEIGHALKLGKKVVAFRSWDLGEFENYESPNEFINCLNSVL